MGKYQIDKDTINYVGEPELPRKTDQKAKLEQEKYFNQSKREETTKKHVHFAIILLLWVSFAAFSIVLLIRVAHLVLPSSIQWIDAEQLQGIDKLIFSGAIGGFIGRNFNKMFNR